MCYAETFDLSESLHTRLNTLTAHDFTWQWSSSPHLKMSINSFFHRPPILSGLDWGTMVSHIKKTFQVFVLSRQLHTLVHCTWMRGMYLLVSVQQGIGQSLYPLRKFILRICVQLTEVRCFSFSFFPPFFFLRQLDWKQNINLFMEAFQILAHTFVSLIY